MDTLSETMVELLIEQEDRISEPVGKASFSYIALKAEKVIRGEVSNVNKN